MKFDHDGKTYTIEFQREYKTIGPHYNEETGETFQVSSTKPYTTVRLLVVDPITNLQTLFRVATVGCWHKEPNFSLENGRLRALKLVTKGLPKEMRPLVWNTYHARLTRIKKELTLAELIETFRKKVEKLGVKYTIEGNGDPHGVTAIYLRHV